MSGKPTYDREEVLQQALELFWDKGFQGTSMKDLGAALRMHPGSIYSAFGSKEKLFEEALERYAATSLEGLKQRLADASGPLQGLVEYVQSLRHLCREEPPARACMLVKTVLETPDDDPVLRRTAEALLAKMEASFAQAFAQAQARGEIPGDADTDRLASWLQMQIFGLRAYAQRSDSDLKIPALADHIAGDLQRLRT